MINQPLWSPELALADSFLLPMIKNKLASISVAKDSFKGAWEGVIRSLNNEGFTKTFQRSQEI
jgi:hypothetical protein